jgi:hypothetical protein
MKYTVADDPKMKQLIDNVIFAAKYVNHRDDRFITDFSDESEIKLRQARTTLEKYINYTVLAYSGE